MSELLSEIYTHNDSSGYQWNCVSVTPPTVDVPGYPLVVVKDENSGPHPYYAGQLAICCSGGGEVWFKDKASEVRVTHWRKMGA